ncbi:hypothetical protein PspS35_03755 [Pseudomonas sp. S35]|uniref:hypothetical protein n=1 Tax=Pseudomonas sp. S35 TaxID=1573719 RepID=UPI00132F1A5E|nr:hypothetical protein [Pseudomonas sp. S35]QHF42945.1 hypothetical protein PspS35_03755 [Pseudomonas sp. S35]
MRISTTNLSEAATPTTKTETPITVNEGSDVNFFNAQMSHGKQPNNPASSVLMDSIAARSTELNMISKKAVRGLRDFSLNKHSKEVRELSKSIGEFQRELTLNVKIINKTIQSVEKITSLG